MRQFVSLVVAVVSGVLAPCAISGSLAATVTITAIALPGERPVQATIKRMVGGVESEFDSTDPKSGTLQFDEAACTTTSYQAEPVEPGAFNFWPAWQHCRTDRPIPFRFFDKRKAASGPILTGAIPPAWGPSSSFVSAIDVIKSATEQGDYGTAAIISSQVSNILAKTGNTAPAKAFGEYAVTTGLSGITEAGSNPAGAAIVYDSKQQQLVLSPSGVEAVKAFQRSKALPESGRLDWGTMRALSPLADEKLFNLNAIAADKLY